MFWLKIFLWLVAAGLIGYGIYRLFKAYDALDSSVQAEKTDAAAQRYKREKKLFVVAFILPAVVIVLFSVSIYVVDPGHAVIIKRLGALTGDYRGEGPHLKAPFIDTVVDYRITLLTYETSNNPDTSKADYTDYSVETMTQDGQKITVRYTVKFQIDPKKLGFIIRNAGNEQDLVERVVKTDSRSESRNIPKGFKAQELYSDKTGERGIYDCQQALFKKLDAVFADNGLILKEFLLREVDFDDDLEAALERKQIALEDQTTAERMIKVKEAEADQKVAEAEGDKQSQIIRAEGEAKAAQLIQDQLSNNPLYVQYVLAKGIAEGKTGIQWGVLPGNMLPILDFKQFMKQAEQK
jgi:prohibitin 2